MTRWGHVCLVQSNDALQIDERRGKLNGINWEQQEPFLKSISEEG